MLLFIGKDLEMLKERLFSICYLCFTNFSSCDLYTNKLSYAQKKDSREIIHCSVHLLEDTSGHPENKTILKPVWSIPNGIPTLSKSIPAERSSRKKRILFYFFILKYATNCQTKTNKQDLQQKKKKMENTKSRARNVKHLSLSSDIFLTI